MTVQQIRALRPALSGYLDEFADCFVSFDTRYHLKEYVSGQLSDLQRKSVQPIARLMDVPPRTLQEFLSLAEWDHDRLRDRVQQLVTRDRGKAQAIAIVDESGYPKKGRKTACVQRQYCGATGKKDNCVMAVHLAYASFDGQFRAMLDSNLYLPEKGWTRSGERRWGSHRPELSSQAPDRAGAVAAGRGQRDAFRVGDGRRMVRGEAGVHQGAGGAEAAFRAGNPEESDGVGAQPSSVNTPRGEVQNMVRWSRPLLDPDGYRITSRTRTRGRWSGKFAGAILDETGRTGGGSVLAGGGAERSGPG